MKWVGLTGGMGCGKSTVLKELKNLGCGVVSADELVHRLYKSPAVIKEVCELLGFSESEFSTALVAKHVFSNPEKLKELENFIHPKLKKMVEASKKDFEAKGIEISFYEVPLLFEKSLQDRFDKTVCVGTDEKTQLRRIKLRNKWSDEEIRKRLSNQMSVEEKKKRSDFYIDNSGELKDLKFLCEDLVEKILA